MIYKIIQTENYLLVVDDSEIKVGNWIISGVNSIVKCIYPDNIIDRDVKKIISHLPLNDAPILRGVDLLPPLEDEVEKLANEIYPFKQDLDYQSIKIDENYNNKKSFIVGYNKAKEKYKYTEDDLIKSLSYGYHTAKDEYKGIPSSGYFTRFMQTLQQPKMPIAFECDTDYYGGDVKWKIETITNSQGQTIWLGKYIFE